MSTTNDVRLFAAILLKVFFSNNNKLLTRTRPDRIERVIFIRSSVVDFFLFFLLVFIISIDERTREEHLAFVVSFQIIGKSFSSPRRRRRV